MIHYTPPDGAEQPHPASPFYVFRDGKLWSAAHLMSRKVILRIMPDHARKSRAAAMAWLAAMERDEPTAVIGCWEYDPPADVLRVLHDWSHKHAAN